MKRKLLIVLIFSSIFSFGQNVYLTKGKKRFLLEANSGIGLRTKNDTIEYFMEKTVNYLIYKTTLDSLIIFKPNKFQDTILKYSAIYHQSLGFKYIMNGYFKKNKVLYCKIKRIIGYEYRKYHYKDLVYLKYYRPSNADGASFLPFIDFPIKLIDNINSNFDLNEKWEIIIEE